VHSGEDTRPIRQGRRAEPACTRLHRRSRLDETVRIVVDRIDLLSRLPAEANRQMVARLRREEAWPSRYQIRIGDEGVGNLMRPGPVAFVAVDHRRFVFGVEGRVATGSASWHEAASKANPVSAVDFEELSKLELIDETSRNASERDLIERAKHECRVAHLGAVAFREAGLAT
jgi:hypothetical protein